MTPLFKKLNYKGQEQVFVLRAPEEFEGALEELATEGPVNVSREIAENSNVDFAICFAKTLTDIDGIAETVDGRLSSDATVWISYPKKSSKKYTCEFNRDNGFNAIGAIGLEPVRQVAIDADWSALRFRKVENIKTITRRESFVISKQGKERTSQKGK